MTTTPHILVVDDDRDIRDLLARYLRKHEVRVDTAPDGRTMFRMLEAGRYDLVILDLMLPGEDGLSLCRRLRATSPLPVIMLTAMSEEPDRVVGLEMGADDYLTKPFSPRELLARVRAVLRRSGAAPAAPAADPAPGATYAFAGWRLDSAARTLTAPDGILITLTGGEYELLLAFVERPNRVLTRDQLLDLTRGRAAVAFDRAVDVQLSRLRRKIEPDPKAPSIIKTVRGGGYVFACEVRRS